MTGTGIADSFVIDWGDNLPPVPTPWATTFFHDYTVTGTYIIELKRVVYDSVYNIFCADSTTDTAVITAINCNTLKASMAVTVNGGSVTLVNNSSPDASYHIGAQYHVTWGDPTGSIITSGKGPYTHPYNVSGTYKVRMVFSLTDPFKTCRDTTDTVISVVVIPANSISGYVKMDSSLTMPGDLVKISLIKFDAGTNMLSAVDSVERTVRDYVAYHFDNKPAGSYRLKAAIVSSQPQTTGNIPTYHDSDLVWSNANVITHTGAYINNATIWMKRGKLTSGPGVVNGKLMQGVVNNGIAGVNVLLLGAADQPVAFDITDANGNYSFSNLPLGTYKVHPENMNYNTTAATVNITSGNTNAQAVDFARYNTSMVIVPIVTGVSDINTNKLQYNVYPNPASGMLVISWGLLSDNLANITITDVSGKQAMANTVKMNGNTTLNIQNLQPGFYFLSVKTEYGSSTQKIIVQ